MTDAPKTPRRFAPTLLVGLVCLVLGAAGGLWGRDQWERFLPATSAFSGDGEVRQNSSSFKYINPLLECDLGQETIGGERTKPSRARLVQLIDEVKGRGAASLVSVYYRDLNNGPWMGIGERERFAPASLLKVPLVMSYYKRAESDPSLLAQTITLGPAREHMPQYFKPSDSMEIGKEYTVEELAERALRYSDNDAAGALVDAVPTDPLRGLFDALHIEPIGMGQDVITVKDYAAFFRVLFNSSYLDNEPSERLLRTLTETSFNKGLTALLPQGVSVAHKFGERSDYGVGMEKQLHDCGIIYIPNHPYLLCVMTRGEDMDRMAGVIADISKTVYDEVIEQRQ